MSIPGSIQSLEKLTLEDAYEIQWKQICHYIDILPSDKHSEFLKRVAVMNAACTPTRGMDVPRGYNLENIYHAVVGQRAATSTPQEHCKLEFAGMMPSAKMTITKQLRFLKANRK